MPLPDALKVATSNPTAAHRLPRKGRIVVGHDADLVLLDDDLQIEGVVARGRVLPSERRPLVHGTFEHSPH